MSVIVKIKLLNEDATKPQYKTLNAACADLYASEDLDINVTETKIVKTGIAIELPEGTQAKVLGRSGLSSKGILVSTGTIDADYRGEIGVIMTNMSEGSFKVSKGDRIAQLDVMKMESVMFINSDNLTNTERGSGGFGSTGK